MNSRAADIAAYLSAPYIRMLIPDAQEGGYLAEVLELPGCISEGDTPEEAYSNLQEAMEGWIATALDRKQPIPVPVGDREYSGHFPLRTSTELHRAAALRAAQEGISLNQWIAKAIAAQVAADNLSERLADEIADKVAQRISVGVFGGFNVHLTGVPVEARTSPEVVVAGPRGMDTLLRAPDARVWTVASGLRDILDVRKVKEDA